MPREKHTTVMRLSNSQAIMLLAAIAVLATVMLVTVTRLGPTTGNPRTVFDEAGLLLHAQVMAIENYHAALLRDHDIDYRILVPKGDPAIDNNVRAHDAFAQYQVGGLSETGKGLLLLIDPQRDEVRLEVSTSLEGVYTDAYVSYIQHFQMIPFFRSGRIADGILATSEMMVDRALEAARGDAFLPPMKSESAGGGALNRARLGTGYDDTFRQGPAVEATADDDPLATLALYQRAMASRNGNPHLEIYTPATSEMLASWELTPAQMDNEAGRIAGCSQARAIVNESFAVIRYPVEARECVPYFLERRQGAWKLDLTMMQHASHEPDSAPWGFAFDDWRFDQYGFPHARD
jgi:uncharacterized protein